MPEKPNKLSQFWQELKRRKVVRVIIVYAAAGFAIIEFVDIVTEPLNLPEWALTLVIVLVAIGFPLAVILAWAYDITPSGIEKTEPVDTLKKLRNNKSFDYKAPLQEKSIIVLPFENISPDKDQEYFSDGLTEEIITDLSHIHDLLVISRTSAMTFKGTTNTLKEIAKRVHVRYVLEGSVRKAANNLRITAQLIDANNDSHIWAEKYDGTLDDVFDIQEKVSRSIVDALKIKLSSQDHKRIAERPIDDIRGFECYLKARQEIWKWKEDALDRALEYLKNGIQIVGDNAMLYAGMAYVYWQYYNLGIKQEEYLKKAEGYTTKTFELDPGSPYGHLVLGLIKMFHNAKEGVKHLKQTLSFDPNNFDALVWLMLIYIHLGKGDAGSYLMEKLKKIDPLNPLIQFIYVKMEVFRGDFQQALISSGKYYNTFKDDPVGRFFYALTLAYTGQLEESYSIFDLIIKDTPRHVIGKLAQLLKDSLQGRITDVTKAKLQEDEIARRDFAFSYWVSNGYALIGETEKSMDWLEIAVNQGMINWPFLNEYDPFLENIRGEEQFKKLMERVKHEWENFKV